MADVIYGLLGRKLGHSWSAPIHKMLGCENYRLIELEPDELADFLSRRDLGAVNVTIPYKCDAFACCDVIDETAALIGSVNTVVRKSDGKLYGYNTDAEGFRYMSKLAGIDFIGKKVIVLGSGGASLTAKTVAVQSGAKEVTVISRTGQDNYENLKKHYDAEIIVNTTPVGMFPDNGRVPIDLKKFGKCIGVLDVVYNPRRTALLIKAEDLGIPCLDGLPMLVAQAVAAERLFFEREIPESEVIRILSELRKSMTNIVLVGMPGCGKTTVGSALAELTGREAIDIDRCIEEKTKLSVSEFFAKHGEEEFRKLECEETERIGKLLGKVILTGGGVVKNPRNYEPLHQNGRIYHLFRNLDDLPTEGRPLSKGADISVMWAERKPMYEKFGDVIVYNKGTTGETASEIWRDFCEHTCD